MFSSFTSWAIPENFQLSTKPMNQGFIFINILTLNFITNETKAECKFLLNKAFILQDVVKLFSADFIKGNIFDKD